MERIGRHVFTFECWGSVSAVRAIIFGLSTAAVTTGIDTFAPRVPCVSAANLHLRVGVGLRTSDAIDSLRVNYLI